MASRTLEITFLGTAKPVQDAFGQVEESSGKLQGKLSGLSSTFGDVAKVAGGFLAAQAITKGPELMGSMADRAKDLQLQMNKATTVFGAAKPIVDDWAKANAAAMGLSRAEATNLATGLADLLIPMGMNRDAAAEMSTKTIGLAGALAEWSGGQVDAKQAAEVLTKAYLGETDGLKALGISISAADVSARLAAKGQESLTGSALEQARALAIQELVFEKSKDAQDAFANGADSAARKQAEATAKMQEAKDALSMALGPAITAVSTKLAELATILAGVAAAAAPMVTVLTDGLGEAFGFVAEHSEPFIAAIAGIASAIMTFMIPATLAWVAAEWAKVAALLASAAAFVVANAPLIALGLAIGAVIAAVVLLVQHWDQVTEKFPVLGRVADEVKARLEAFVGWISGTFVPGALALYSGVQAAVDKTIGYVRDHWDEIRGIIEPALKALAVIVDAQVQAWKAAIETVLGTIKGIVDVFMGVFTGDWQRAWEGVKQIVGSVWDGIKGAIETAIGLIKGLAPLMLDAGKALLDAFWEGMKGIGGKLEEVIESIGKGIANGVIAVMNTAIQTINDLIPDKISLTGLPDINLPDNPIPTIPALAGGGIVTRPTLALLGEAGPEAVIPLRRIAPSETSRPAVNITNTVTITVEGNADEEVLRQAMNRWLEEQTMTGALAYGVNAYNERAY